MKILPDNITIKGYSAYSALKKYSFAYWLAILVNLWALPFLPMIKEFDKELKNKK
ncbi:hypothetical protein [Lactococcus lactis]|uniref:hypothetical protein n=1 Tax=Lactococcus lactis TaxID=1358 RepID=UPI0018C668CE|nr:hypothetical protein [Lactococcus lactis]